MSRYSLLNDKCEIVNSIERWNSIFPFDHAWREKYKIPYGSTQHRQMSFFDIKFDIVEERYFNKLNSKINSRKKPSQQLLKSKVSKKVLEQEAIEDFENLDLSKFDEIK